MADRRETDLFGRTAPTAPGARQLPLPLAWTRNFSADVAGFLVGPSNERAVRHLRNVGDWPVPAALLVGPEGCGKSLLGRLFVDETGGEFVDQIEQAGDEELFHAWNRALDSNRPILIAAASMATARHALLPDLTTRLNATPAVEIADPDPELAAALVEHLLCKRQHIVSPGVGHYVARRIERRYGAVHRAVDALAQSAGAGGAVTVRLAGEALRNAGFAEEEASA